MMILEDNKIRLKFYKCDYIPRYPLIELNPSVSSVNDNTKSSMLNSIILDDGSINTIRNNSFLNMTSFNIMDNDLLINPVSVIIDNNGIIRIGKVPDNNELIESIGIFLGFYIKGINNSLVNSIITFLSKGNFNNKVSNINISLPDKCMSFNLVSPSKRLIRENETIDLNSSMYSFSFKSYEAYLDYINKNSTVQKGSKP